LVCARGVDVFGRQPQGVALGAALPLLACTCSSRPVRAIFELAEQN
jgi:hypothetical protein